MNFSNIANTNIITVYELINQLPQKVYGKLEEAISHCEAEDVNFIELAQDIESLAKNAEIILIDTEDGAKYWGDRLGIQLADIQSLEDANEWASKLQIVLTGSTLAEKTLEIHKEQLLQLNGFNVNYTWAWLQKKIDDYVGDAEYTLQLDIQNFTLIVSTPNASSTWANQVTWLIDKTLPSNIAYFFQIRSDNDYITTLVNTWSHTHYQYYLNYWCLGQNPFVKQQNFITTTDNLNIPDDGWEEIANSFSQIVSYAKWNDIYNAEVVSTTFNIASRAIECIVQMDFTVGKTSVENIKIFDSNNNVLAEADVFIPYSNSHSNMQVIFNFTVGIQ